MPEKKLLELQNEWLLVNPIYVHLRVVCMGEWSNEILIIIMIIIIYWQIKVNGGTTAQYLFRIIVSYYNEPNRTYNLQRTMF